VTSAPPLVQGARALLLIQAGSDGEADAWAVIVGIAAAPHGKNPRVMLQVIATRWAE
jgi:hypothetical protein